LGDNQVSAWERARRATVVEDDGQRQLVTLLTQPIVAADTAGQARRVEAMERLIKVMSPSSAARLHSRLSDAHDPLGQLFQLELHRRTRASVLGQLNSQRLGFDRGTGLTNRGTDTKNVVAPQKTSEQSNGTSAPVTQGLDAIPWPKWSPPKPPWMDPKLWHPPSDIPVVPVPKGNQLLDDPTRRGPGWASRIVSSVVGGLVIVVAGGSTAATAAKGLEAAWIVFQTAGNMTLEKVIGQAGEEAMQAMLPDQFGLAPGTAANLNTIVPNFPVYDLTSSGPIVSVKVKGVLSTLPFSREDLAEFYGRGAAREFLEMCGLDTLSMPTLSLHKNTQAAQLLFDHRSALLKQGVWPKALKATTVEGIEKYLVNNGLYATLDDYVAPTQRNVVALLRQMRDSGELANRYGITVPKGEWTQWLKARAARIVGVGIDSDDMADMLLTAKDLPKLQSAELQELMKNLDRRKALRKLK
jgi:hypothetical protein